MKSHIRLSAFVIAVMHLMGAAILSEAAERTVLIEEFAATW